MLNARSFNLCITEAILQQKALEIAKELNMSDLQPFINLDKPMESSSCHQSVSGESDSVDMTVVSDFQTVVLSKIIEDYEPRNRPIFNADEPGLFWLCSTNN